MNLIFISIDSVLIIILLSLLFWVKLIVKISDKGLLLQILSLMLSVIAMLFASVFSVFKIKNYSSDSVYTFQGLADTMTFAQQIFLLTCFNLDFYKWVIFLVATNSNLQSLAKAQFCLIISITFIEVVLVALFVGTVISIFALIKNGQLSPLFSCLYPIYIIYIFVYMFLLIKIFMRLFTKFPQFYEREGTKLKVISITLLFTLVGMSVICYLYQRNDIQCLLR